MEIFFAGTYLEVVHRYSEVGLGVADKGCAFFRPHLVGCYKFKVEFLLVHCRGRHKGGFHSLGKPVGGVRTDVAHLPGRLSLVFAAFFGGITDGYTHNHFLILGNGVNPVDFLVGQADDTRGQSKPLGKQHKLLAEISGAVVKRIGFLANHHYVVVDVAERAIGKETLESLGFVSDQLDVQVSLTVQFVNFRAQGFNHVRFERAWGIFSYGVAVFECFEFSHDYLGNGGGQGDEIVNGELFGSQGGQGMVGGKVGTEGADGVADGLAALAEGCFDHGLE